MSLPRRVTAALLAFSALALAGCGDTPRAPALADETVYQNDAVGVRFLTPEGWQLYAKTTLPPGPLDRPIRLTAYSRSADKFSAEFELYAVDVRPGGDLLDYLGTHKLGPELWVPLRKLAPEAVGGVPATRYALAGVKGDAKMRREIIAFPRGDRQYLFVFTHHDDDATAREQARKAVESVTWR